MTFAIGGTAKVRRVVKQARTEPWTCACRNQACPSPCDDVCLSCIETRREHPAPLVRCPDCGTKRP